MIITVTNPRRAMSGGSVDVDDFADIGGCTAVLWGPDGLDVHFEGKDLTPTEQATVVARCEALGSNDETLRARARVALVDDRAYLALSPPTQAQVVAQVAALTRHDVSVIRMLLGDLEGTD